MANGSENGTWARWMIGILVSTGLMGTGALTKSVWDVGQEQAAARERDKYIIEELRGNRIELEKMRADINTLLTRR